VGCGHEVSGKPIITPFFLSNRLIDDSFLVYQRVIAKSMQNKVELGYGTRLGLRREKWIEAMLMGKERQGQRGCKKMQKEFDFEPVKAEFLLRYSKERRIRQVTARNAVFEEIIVRNFALSSGEENMNLCGAVGA
jgi:hypothetical protein